MSHSDIQKGPACTCGMTMEAAHAPGSVGDVWHCPSCARAIPRGQTTIALKLPGLQPGRPQNTVPEMEEPILQRVITVLTRCGYQVESLVRRRKMQHCEKCNTYFHQQGGDGVSLYVGDLLVAIPREKPLVWIMLDTKATHGRGQTGQKDTAAKGLLFFVKSGEEALHVVQNAEKLFSEGAG